jgi:predicted signal transduction protein with EAL and GGDEF domain
MWTTFDEAMAAELRSHHGLEADLRSAVTDGSVEPWYQPIVSGQSRSIVGVEALARWQHPERGLLLPGLLIPIAEQSSLIIDLVIASRQQGFSSKLPRAYCSAISIRRKSGFCAFVGSASELLSTILAPAI